MRLPEAIKEDVRRRTYSRGHALELARLPGSSLQLSTSKMIPDRLTREQTRKLVDSILMGKKTPKLGKTAILSHLDPAKEEDPLADLWPEFMMNPWITTPGSLKVKYLGDWKWSFEVPGPTTNMETLTQSEQRASLRSWLSKLLARMGRSLSYETGKPPSSSTPEPSPGTPPEA
jgi:hypothetical protein